jgi:C-terminal processing protease CtpA/Prc
MVMAEKERLINFGFRKLEILKGNVGYLDLRYFSNPDYAGATAVATMNFLANSDAVIIDLRDTPGGEPTMVQLLSSYFVRATDQDRTHLNTLEQVYDERLNNTGRSHTFRASACTTRIYIS